ncbi:MAG: type II toxin-antitoxin system prevent-host-death family antitoxin [Brevundimonas sp.]|uniref:type II toxin-antitoxin system Phd/YefM family antitoxin n=1 Tax=Brevundimonas sp. TaxID=1871086 RepID=UPI0027333155|nr:type II toxin-antitoxin system prevent-host-death family antitoxin [Brevundimonas sp.]MDP3404944.1 type II toxin-antitoxin system prevent-host-death family antitoxin [Brevundimonas sp.]
MTTVTVHEAKTHLSRLIAAAERGEEVVICRGTTPVVKLTPLNTVLPREPRKSGRLKDNGSFDDTFFDPLPEDELRLWEGDGE